MKTLITRAISGAVYVLLILSGIFFIQIGYVLFALFMLTGIWEFLRMNHKRLSSLKFFLAIFSALFIYLFAWFLRHDVEVISFFTGVALTEITLLIIYLFAKSMNLAQKSAILLSVLYIVIPMSLVPFWLSDNGMLTPDNLMILFITIWIYDTFAYLTGITLGKHKMFPTVSPKKSWEGFAGGTIVTLLFGYLVWSKGMVRGFDIVDFELFILIVIIAATLGDLVESKFKREANVKDSGQIIPGHGGVLDRLDSFIFALPCATVWFLLMH